MKKLMRLLRRIRVRFVQSSRRTKRTVIVMIAVCMIALLTLNLTIQALNKRAEEARKEAARLEYEQSLLEEKVDNLGSSEGAEDAARDEGYVDKDTVVITPRPEQ